MSTDLASQLAAPPGDTAAEDTIAAIATPPGVGGIGVIRISGSNAFSVGMAIFRSAGASGDEPPASHLLTYGHVVDPVSGEIVDEVLAAFMRAPRTYTREDVVEISGHGAPLVLRRILELALAAGARSARPGEMTLRAFLNGRLDLSQAEAVMALVNAETDAGRRLALRQLQGALAECVHAARESTMASLVRIEASIDFPEEEVPLPDAEELDAYMHRALDEVDGLLAGAERGRVLREGLRVALVGRPNVGKSSLLNALLGTERAIVTPVPGTTRDTIEERATLGGIALHLVDTAGLSPTEDPVERIGVERSLAAARSADLLLLVLDGSQPLSDLDLRAAADLRALREEASLYEASTLPVVAVLNKSDLLPVVSDSQVAALWPDAPIVHSSAVVADGTRSLEEAIVALALGGSAQGADSLVSSTRHHDALRRARERLAAARTTLADGLPLDFVTIDLRAALDALGEITGETATADLLDEIFAQFCIGK
jgi:tRNA modification GTPase